MAVPVHHHLKLVSKTSERMAIECVVDRFRLVFERWDKDDHYALYTYSRSRKESDECRKYVWAICLAKHDSATILAVMELVLSGETEFNVTPPTPMQFSELCNRLKNKRNERPERLNDIFKL